MKLNDLLFQNCMNRIELFDESLFRWINGHHCTMLDWTMWTFSQSWSWLIVILLVYIFITLRTDRKNWMWILLGVALCFLLADQISNNALKDGVQRLRPCYQLPDVRMFRTGKGGLYGFPSSHAANAFSVAMFLSLAYGRKHKTLAWIIFSWATIVAYSRPYLGKHYPADILCGALLGLGIGAAVYFVISRIRARTSSTRSA